MRAFSAAVAGPVTSLTREHGATLAEISPYYVCVSEERRSSVVKASLEREHGHLR